MCLLVLHYCFTAAVSVSSVKSVLGYEMSNESRPCSEVHPTGSSQSRAVTVRSVLLSVVTQHGQSVDLQRGNWIEVQEDQDSIQSIIDARWNYNQLHISRITSSPKFFFC